MINNRSQTEPRDRTQNQKENWKVWKTSGKLTEWTDLTT